MSFNIQSDSSEEEINDSDDDINNSDDKIDDKDDDSSSDNIQIKELLIQQEEKLVI